jgi:hypothetical protein
VGGTARRGRDEHGDGEDLLRLRYARSTEVINFNAAVHLSTAKCSRT